MPKYKILVTEILQAHVIVEANSEEDAYTRIRDAWNNTEFLLGPEDSQGAEFYITGEEEPGDEKLEHIDPCFEQD